MIFGFCGSSGDPFLSSSAFAGVSEPEGIPIKQVFGNVVLSAKIRYF
jgi:hypothetical protein